MNNKILEYLKEQVKQEVAARAIEGWNAEDEQISVATIYKLIDETDEKFITEGQKDGKVKTASKTIKVLMFRNACGIEDWMKRKAAVETMMTGRNYEPSEVVIEKTIYLTSEQYKKFADGFLDDVDFIKENINLMKVDENGIWHCIKVTVKGSKQSVLVESDGYEYARYTSVINE